MEFILIPIALSARLARLPESWFMVKCGNFRLRNKVTSEQETRVISEYLKIKISETIDAVGLKCYCDLGSV